MSKQDFQSKLSYSRDMFMVDSTNPNQSRISSKDIYYNDQDPVNMSVSNMSPRSNNYIDNNTASNFGYRRSNITNSNSFRNIESYNINNKLKQLQLSIITIFSISLKQGIEEKYILVRDLLGQKFIIKASEENYYVNAEGGDVYEYQPYEGSFLEDDDNLNVPDISNVMYTCGSNGICILANDSDTPNKMNFVAKNNIQREVGYIEGAITGYPLISLSELNTYDHTNYHELYNKIKKETCSIRLQFIKMHKPVIKKIEEDIIDFSHNVKCVIDMIKTMSRDIFSNCGELTNSCCEKLENTSYDRLLQLIAASNSIGAKHPHEMIKRCCEYNDKIEIFFSIIRSFTIDFNKLYEISDVVKQIKCELERVN